MKKIKSSYLNNIFFFFIYFIFFFLFLLNRTFSASILEIKQDDLIIGNLEAPITVIEYASLSCSHCANFHQNTLPQIIKEYVDKNKVKIVFRDFPLNYPALMGSMILQCIDNDVRYEYLSALFMLQSKWVNPDFEITKKELLKILQAGGMTKDQFNQCLDNVDLENKIHVGWRQNYCLSKKYDRLNTPNKMVILISLKILEF